MERPEKINVSKINDDKIEIMCSDEMSGSGIGMVISQNGYDALRHHFLTGINEVSSDNIPNIRLNGSSLIAKERSEQIEKHGRTTEKDVVENTRGQLTDAAQFILMKCRFEMNPPTNWDESIWNKMVKKPYKERLIIAGALLAAEIDRIQALE